MSLLKDIWSSVSGIGKGMAKTQAEFSEPVFTQMYPFVQPDLPPTSCQSLALIKDENGEDRCVSCLACEKICPSQVITIERKRNPAGKGFILERFDIDMVNCMYCAMCVESCPASAIVTVQDFELSTPNLQTLKFDKNFLDEQGLRAGQWYSPKFGVEYREPGDSVHGHIVKAPLTEQPGGLELMAKEREKAEKAALAAAATAAPAAAPAEKPVPAVPVVKADAPAASAPVVAPPDTTEAPGTVVVAPASSPAAATSEAPVSAAGAEPAVEGERVKKPTKRWEPKNKPLEGDGMPPKGGSE